MVEISQSGSGEGSGWVTARPTLQRHFSAGLASAQSTGTPCTPWSSSICSMMLFLHETGVTKLHLNDVNQFDDTH
jgi:hypothetical protein